METDALGRPQADFPHTHAIAFGEKAGPYSRVELAPDELILERGGPVCAWLREFWHQHLRRERVVQASYVE
jgi:hypothetical protein